MSRGRPEKAKQLAARYGVNEKNIYNYQNYDKIKDNPDVDAIYIVLPNGMHYYIRENHRPENRAELRLVVNAGSSSLKFSVFPAGPGGATGVGPSDVR